MSRQKRGVYYKVTDVDGESLGGMSWRPGRTNRATGPGAELCSNGVLHAYASRELAAIMHPSHVMYLGPLRMFEVSGVPVCGDATKVGFKSLKVLREIDFPKKPTRTQAQAFAVLTALTVVRDREFRAWAKKWLSGEDRSARAARRAFRDLPHGLGDWLPDSVLDRSLVRNRAGARSLAGKVGRLILDLTLEERIKYLVSAARKAFKY